MLKMLLPFIALAAIALTVCSYEDENFLPENDLWKYDYIEKSNFGQENFNRVIDAAYEVYLPVSEKFGDSSLTINKLWEDSTVNANVSRFFGNVTINMYGGLFRRPETTLEGFALVVCHELGHAYGGAPYISSWQKLSAEGQADYIGARECLYRVIEKLNLEGYELEPTDYMKVICSNFFDNPAQKNLCERSLIGGQSLGNLLATIKEEEIPDYQTPDPTEVEQTLTSYPETIQCRLDTYLRGTLRLKRPSCWFKEE